MDVYLIRDYLIFFFKNTSASQFQEEKDNRTLLYLFAGHISLCILFIYQFTAEFTNWDHIFPFCNCHTSRNPVDGSKVHCDKRAAGKVIVCCCCCCLFVLANSVIVWRRYMHYIFPLLHRYLLYDVNPPEGFNLRRDVYIRMASLVKTLRKDGGDWVLVLPPWGRLYHWQSPNIYQVRIPWGEFFSLTSLQANVPVIEYEEFIAG